MLVADEFCGPLEDDTLAAAVEQEGYLTVTVDDTERRRSRVRTTAEDGTDLGIVVARELRDGDVLGADGRFVVVSLAETTALVLDFGGADEDAALTALELGHAVGNRHWDLTVEGERAYLPVTDSRERMEATVNPYLPDGVTKHYEDVSPTLFDDESAGYYGSDEHEPDHGHGHGSDSEHHHGRGHGHRTSHDRYPDHDRSHDDSGRQFELDNGEGEDS
jgi:urease accessory protein